MTTVLILAYDFPPYISVGAQRPYYWYQNFTKWAIFPIVITRQWKKNQGGEKAYVSAGYSVNNIIDIEENGITIKTPYHPNFANRLFLKHGEDKYKLIRKLYTASLEFLQFFFKIGPKKNIYFAANDYIKNNQVDLIIATGDPYILLKYASDLSKKHKIPWIADYRDPWANTDKKIKSPFRQRFESMMEKRINSSADAIITVSDLLIKMIIGAKDKTYIISNGFGDNVIEQSLNPQSKDVFNIGFAGTVHKFYPTEIFLKSFDDFIKKNALKNIKLNFFGISNQKQLEQFILQSYPALYKYISFEPKMENNVLLQKLSTQNVLLLFNSYATTGTKIYEYLGLKRKILFCFTEEKEALDLYYKHRRVGNDIVIDLLTQAKLISETNSGVLVKDRFNLYYVLSDLYHEFANNGFIACNSMGIQNYSRYIQTKNLAGLIKNIVK